MSFLAERFLFSELGLLKVNIYSSNELTTQAQRTRRIAGIKTSVTSVVGKKDFKFNEDSCPAGCSCSMRWEQPIMRQEKGSPP
jgi:hypothetical protein